MDDPRFKEAAARTRAARERAEAASKDLEATVAQVSATNMHDHIGADRSRPLDRVYRTSALYGLHKDVTAAERAAGGAAVAPLVAAQRAEWKRGVGTLRAKGLAAPKDFHGGEIGDSTDSAAAAPSAASSARAETEAERAERRAMERARRTVMRTMGIPDKRGPKLAEGPHLVDHVRALRQFSSAGADMYVTESRGAFRRDAEFEEEVAKNARRTDCKLKKNAFTEYTEAVAFYGKMMGAKGK